MNAEIFINKINLLSSRNEGIRTYPIEGNQKKNYSRFLERLFWIDDINLFKEGWLGNLYTLSNGVDLNNYYIVPYNNYFNKKNLPFDEFCRDWIVNQDNPNEILADFYSFMTDDKSLIGYLNGMKNVRGFNYIGYTSKMKNINDVEIIFSSIYSLYEYILETLNNNEFLNFYKPLDFWRERDQELDEAYNSKIILEYKKAYLLQDNSESIK